MGIKTRVYELDDDLAINIPSEVLPPSKMQLIEERVETPGYEAETETWYDVIVRPYKGRTALLLTHDIGISPLEAMTRLGLDPDKPIFIRPYGFKEWVRAHLYHGFYGRVWVPRYIARRTRMREYTVYPVMIRGITMPRIEIQLVRREVKTVEVDHMGKTYPTENYAPNKWRWRIPRNIDCYPVMVTALGIHIYPDAECHREDEIVLVDFSFSKAAGRVVSEKTGYAFRNMAVRNYTATTELDEYPFLCEIRATYISSCPKAFYQPDEIHHIELREALQITVYNMLQHFFTRLINKETGEELPYSTMSYADHIDAIDYTTNTVALKRSYPKIELDERWKEKYISYDAEGEGIPSEEFGVEEKRFYQCIKYVRVLNESSYKAHDIDRWVYTDMDITSMILERQRMRVMNGLKPEVEIDVNGFIWRT